jgi:hypothetical protein
MRKTILFSIVFLFIGFIANAQTQFYSGTSDGNEIKAQITWKADETIYGSYYFNGNSSRVYKLSGTNYVQGEIEVVESFNGRRTGSGTLTKTLTKGRVIWSGYIYNVDGTQSYIYLTRIR